jgi:hypothetical protein
MQKSLQLEITTTEHALPDQGVFRSTDFPHFQAQFRVSSCDFVQFFASIKLQQTLYFIGFSLLS